MEDIVIKFKKKDKPKIRQKWFIKPIERIKVSKKTYTRSKSKKEFKKELEEKGC